MIFTALDKHAESNGPGKISDLMFNADGAALDLIADSNACWEEAGLSSFKVARGILFCEICLVGWRNMLAEDGEKAW